MMPKIKYLKNSQELTLMFFCLYHQTNYIN